VSEVALTPGWGLEYLRWCSWFFSVALDWVFELIWQMDRLERRLSSPNSSMLSSATTQSSQLPQLGT
jgi:hypothetical protein